MTGRALLSVYRAAAVAASPGVAVALRRRARAGKEDAARLPERFGHASGERPAGPVVWIHAASVGESLSVLPLIGAVRARWPRVTPLLTTGTVTSAALMAGRLPAGAIHQYVPVDLPAAQRRFLGHWRPDLALRVESELWPNALTALGAARIPAILLNARMSARSFGRWRRVRPLARRLLSGFAAVFAQSEDDAARLLALGAAEARTLGNLKDASAPLPADEAALGALAAAVAGRAMWVAVSTHDGEEAIAAQVHRTLAVAHPGLLTVLVPRHPARGAAVAAALGAGGLATALRSAGDGPAADTSVYVADTLGEVGLWCRLAAVVFVGGSLVPHGGHNALEPARLGRAVVFGPHMENFRDQAAALLAAGGAVGVEDSAELAATLGRLLSAGGERSRMGAAAAACAASRAGVLDATVDALAPWFAAIP